MPKYPSQIDTSLSLPIAIDNLTPVQGSIFNKLRDAVIAIEQELGVKPSASYSTVRSRLDTIENIVGNLQLIKLEGDLGGTVNLPKIIGIQGFPISTATPEINNILGWNGIAWTPSILNDLSGIPVSLSGNSNDLTLNHVGKYLIISHGSATTLTVPLNSSIPFKIGTIISGIQAGAGQLTIVATVGVTINTPETLKLRKQWSSFSLKKVAINTWDLSGYLQNAP